MISDWDWINEWKAWFPKECRDVVLKTASGTEFTVPLLIGNVALFFVEKPLERYIEAGNDWERTYGERVLNCLNVEGLKIAWVVKGEPPTSEGYFYQNFPIEYKRQQEMFHLWQNSFPKPYAIIWHTPHPSISKEAFWKINSIEAIEKKKKIVKACATQCRSFEELCARLMPIRKSDASIEMLTPNSLEVKFVKDEQDPHRSYYKAYQSLHCENKTLLISLDHPLFVRGDITAKAIYSDCGIVATGQIYAQTMWIDAHGIMRSNKEVGKIQVNGSIYASKDIITVDLKASGDIRTKKDIMAKQVHAGGHIEACSIYAGSISQAEYTEEKEYQWLPIDALKRKRK